MKLYTTKIDTDAAKVIVADDMFLTKDMPTAAGSKMLDNYMSLLEAEAITRAKAAGYTLGGKADVGDGCHSAAGAAQCAAQLILRGVNGQTQTTTCLREGIGAADGACSSVACHQNDAGVLGACGGAYRLFADFYAACLFGKTDQR